VRRFIQEPTNPYGINKLLLSIVDKDMDETIIIEMAAENPPKNTKTVRALLSKNCGLIGNRYLHSDLSFKRMLPPQAIGKTKILKVINTMGKAIVLFEYVFSLFSTLQYEIVWVKER
jgi:hypothetical protein